MTARKKAVPVFVSSEERAKQVQAVIELMGEGKSERAACLEVGIDRNTFRMSALRAGAQASYTEALATLAHEQIVRMEQAIEDMRDGKIDPNMARVELDTRKWFAVKLFPRRYGEKMQLDARIETRPAEALTDEELASIAAGRGSGTSEA